MRFLPWVAVTLLCFLDCRGPAEPPTTPPVVLSTNTPPDELVDAGEADVQASLQVDATPGPAKHPSDPKRFACGPDTCASGTETCCQASDQGACIPTLKDGPHGQIGFFKAQWEACDHAKLAYSLSGISRCDESVDCGSTEICCEQFLFSGGSVNLCEAPNKNGATPCEYGEVCLDGSPCRIPGTMCLDGYCKKPVENLRCSGEVCGPDQSCCGESLECKPRAQCKPDEPRVACAKPSDCIKGQTCVLQSERSSGCTGLVDRVTPGWWEERGIQAVCERTSDCVGVCQTKGQHMVCKDSALYKIKACVCT